jgi:hypothetical protein
LRRADEPDVEALFRQQFRRDLRAGRFEMEFADRSQWRFNALPALANESLILILSDINMPGKGHSAGYSDHHDHCLRRCGD